MAALATIFDYMRQFSSELGTRIIESFPPLQSPETEVLPLLEKLRRQPFPAQALAIMGSVRFFQTGAKAAKLVAECGTGKTLMSMSACYAHANGRRFSAIVMCPPHLPEKWAREVFLTIPNPVRVFIVEDMRNAADPKKPHGIVEVVLQKGRIKRQGINIPLSKLRQLGRKGFQELCPENSFFILTKERGKLGYFWRHAFNVAKSGQNLGYLVSPDSGKTVETSDRAQLTKLDLDKSKYTTVHERGKDGTKIHSAMWQANPSKIQRMAPLEFMGRYMKNFFDYAIADELHQLAGDTAQGNALGTLGKISHHLLGLTGTMMGGYADDLFNILYRMDGPQMARDGFEYGGGGRSIFQATYGVREEVVH